MKRQSTDGGSGLSSSRRAAARRHTQGDGAREDGDYVTALERGLRVLEAFSRAHAEVTLSEMAALTQLSPATARRSLHTLEALGYIGRIGRRFLLRPKVLTLTSAYLTAIDAQAVLQPFLQDVVNDVGGSSSITVLDDLEILYLAHASANRAIRLGAGVGSRYPAYATSMGRVLLAYQSPDALDDYFARARFEKLTDRTEVRPRKLRAILDRVRRDGHSIVQDELDYGLISVAVPIFAPSGAVVAAANCSDVTSRSDATAMLKHRLPALRAAVRRIELNVTKYPVFVDSVLSERVRLPHARSVARGDGGRE